MTRREFTSRLAMLIIYARDCGYDPFLEDVHRSDEEQRRLFEHGLSKCDGRTNTSKHQMGRAADLYLWDAETNRITGHEGKPAYEQLHIFWENLGGKPMIEWDLHHFEG